MQIFHGHPQKRMAEPTSQFSGIIPESIQHYLNDNNSSKNIIKDQVFVKSREVLSARKRDFVVNNAKGNRPQSARELTEEEEGFLFQSGQLGENDPEILQRTVWWVLSLYFGFRARDESRRLQWGRYWSKKWIKDKARRRSLQSL